MCEQQLTLPDRWRNTSVLTKGDFAHSQEKLVWKIILCMLVGLMFYNPDSTWMNATSDF